MTFGDFRIGWRLLRKEPAYSGAAIGGLAIAFAVCILLFGFVRYCFTYNAHLPDSERVYILKERRNMLPRPEWRASAPAALRTVAEASGPGVSATRAQVINVAARNGALTVPLDLLVVDANYLAFFGVQVVTGNAAAALSRPDALVLSETRARQLFGTAEAMGKVLHIDGMPFDVQAILADAPGNTTVAFDALVGRGQKRWDRPEWKAARQVYVKLPAGADAAALAQVLQGAVSEHVDRHYPAAWHQRLQGARLTDIGMTPLTDLYFDEDLLLSRAGNQYGSKPLVLSLAALAMLILVLAGTNYINLAAVRTMSRQREIGVRKVLGAGAARLAGQFVAESVLVCMLAAVGGLILAWLATPLFGELVNRPMTGLIDAYVCLGTLLLGALSGVLSALYPAWIALRLPVGDILNARDGAETRGALRLRRSATVFQCATAIALIGMTLAVGWQAEFASKADPGFDAAPLLVLSLPDEPDAGAARAFQEQLTRLSQVDGVAAIAEAIGRDGMRVTQTIDIAGGASVAIEAKPVSANFFALLGVRPEFGRVFDPAIDLPGSSNVLVNALGARALGFDKAEDAIGRMVDGDKRIVGIAPDLRYRTLREKPAPLLYVMDPAQSVLLVRVRGDRSAVMASIGVLWQRHFPDAVFEIVPAAAVFAENYSADRRLGKILTAASVVATALAAFGIYVLSAYGVRRRAREIVLRKIHGAGRAAIGRLVVREFAALLALGSVIGIPLAMLGIERYLSPFAQRAPMGAWPAVAALACVMLVALVAIARHTLGAMRMLPAAALRT